jgi:hypothetical protein
MATAIQSRYVTGFCNVGLHEGTSPTSPSGKPMKVCVAHEVCTCHCHKFFTDMYKTAGVVRVCHQNPRYEPAHPVDLTWLDDVRKAALLAASVRRPEPIEQPSSVLPSLVETANSFTPTEDGHRARGQLEMEVQRICFEYLAGDSDFCDEPLTTAACAEQINPDSPPSSGAVGAVFDRWEKIGYAIIHHKPIFFAGLTLDGMAHGLGYCKDKAKGKR